MYDEPMTLLGDVAVAATYSDEEVLSRSINEPRLFGLLVDRYEDAFIRKAKLVVRSHEEAEDIVHETFTKIYVYARKFTPQEGATFKSWGYKILMNTAFTHYQKQKKKGLAIDVLDPEMYEELPDAHVQGEEDELRNLVASVLARMPDKFARPLRLHTMEEYSQKEIAELEGTTVAAIKTRIYRAKQLFEQLLGSSHYKQ